MRNEKLKAADPKRMLPQDFTINVNRLPIVAGKIHFIRAVDSIGRISILNEHFDVGEEYIDEYVWATVETMKQMLTVYYKDEDLAVREIKRFRYDACEKVYDRRDSIFKSGSR